MLPLGGPGRAWQFFYNNCDRSWPDDRQEQWPLLSRIPVQCMCDGAIAIYRSTAYRNRSVSCWPGLAPAAHFVRSLSAGQYIAIYRGWLEVSMWLQASEVMRWTNFAPDRPITTLSKSTQSAFHHSPKSKKADKWRFSTRNSAQHLELDTQWWNAFRLLTKCFSPKSELPQQEVRAYLKM